MNARCGKLSPEPARAFVFSTSRLASWVSQPIEEPDLLTLTERREVLPRLLFQLFAFLNVQFERVEIVRLLVVCFAWFAHSDTSSTDRPPYVSPDVIPCARMYCTASDRVLKCFVPSVSR